VSRRTDETRHSISEEIVRRAWKGFIATSPAVISLPRFLHWVGDNDPKVLRVLSEQTLTEVARRVFDQEAAPDMPTS
jgi:hypothetical protein